MSGVLAGRGPCSLVGPPPAPGNTNDMKKLDAAEWAEVRVLYEGGELLVRDIAERFGITDRTILERARTGSWLRRAGRTAKPVGRKGPEAPVPPGHPTRAVRQALIRRLYKAIDIKLKHWEDRMAGGEELSPADSERMAKEVTTMISGFERVAETEGAIEKRDAQSTTAGSGAHAKRGKRRGTADTNAAGGPESDAERMRREIAARLERLQLGRGEASGAR